MGLSLAAPTEPLAELNTTPLVDIMLVLLVMLILALPPVTNTLELPLPRHDPHPLIHPDKVRNTITLTAADAILWNGRLVSEAELEALLHEAVVLRPEPELQLAPDGAAGYAATARVLRLVKLSGASRIGFVGNERYRTFAG
jgi:biopolymer transport protein ExbD